MSTHPDFLADDRRAALAREAALPFPPGLPAAGPPPPVLRLAVPAAADPDPRYAVAKRALDVTLSLAALAVAAPAMALIALAIKLDSPGPVFYASPRWGRRGRPMAILKFRTMTTGAAERLERDPALRAAYDKAMKLDRDPRVTRVGRFLRRWSLDELPQLVDVLAGRMSLVGPRPKLLDERERFGIALEPVLSVPPGLTGLWQVSGRSRTTYQERIALDLAYAASPGFVSDLRILLRTLPVVLRGDGAK
jgi:lipopolysaccharide/colanic/teichoic acid biosynthesis glycosyltransferase